MSKWLLTLFVLSFPALAAEPVFYPANGAPFAKAVRAGDNFYLSGIIGATHEGKLSSDFDAQITQLMDNLKERTGSLNIRMSDIVKCTVMIDDMSKWSQFNRIYVSYFEPQKLPARSAFGANGLALGAAAELECIAYVPSEKK